MALIDLSMPFGGERPGIDPIALPLREAQIAKDVQLYSGALRPWRVRVKANKPGQSEINTAAVPSIYLYNAQPGKDAFGFIVSAEATTPVTIKTLQAHGRTTGDRVYINNTRFAVDEGTYSITVTDANSFTLDGTISSLIGPYIFSWTQTSLACAYLWTSGSSNFSWNVPISSFIGAFAPGIASYIFSWTQTALAAAYLWTNRFSSFSWTSFFGTWFFQNGYWMGWLARVNIERGPVPADVDERIYYTGTGIPQFTYFALATVGGTNYPVASLHLGIPGENSALTATVTGTAPTYPSLLNSRAYVYTYIRKINGISDEGPPSLASAIVQVGPGQSVDLSSIGVGPGGSYGITNVRIYRLNTGSATANYQFVAELAIGTTVYTDVTSDADLSLLILPSTDWDGPPDDLHSLVKMPNGILAGISKDQICFCEPYQPHAWPIQYRYGMNRNGVALGTFLSSVVVGTEDNPWIWSGSHPAYMSGVKGDEGQACSSNRSMVVIGNAVFFASPEGLMRVGYGGSGIVTLGWWTKETWKYQIKPESIHAYNLDGRYLAFYNNGTVQGGFIFDPRGGHDAITFLSVYAQTGYTDPLSDTLYLYICGTIEAWNIGLTDSPYTYKSRKYLSPWPVNPGVGQVIATDYPATFKLFADGSLKSTVVVNSEEPFRLPAGYRGKQFEIQLEGTAIIRRVLLGESIADVKPA